jgi:hypothetical protein
MANPLLGAALALTFLLLLDLRRRLDGLPARIWSIAKQERDRDEKKAATALTEAAAAKVISITAALRVYEEELAARSRLSLADAEKRARIAERRLSDAGAALDAATALVRELRAVLDQARAAAPPAPAEPDPDTRATVEMPWRAAPPAPGESRDSEEPEELTTVATRPVAIAPPGSAEPLSPEPAQLAAGLTRPAATSRPRGATPPSGVTTSSERRRATVLGLAPVGPRRAHGSAPTLVSMAAVTPPSPRPAPRVVVEGEPTDPGE